LQLINWQAIVDEHGQRVWQTAYRLLGDHADAADCFQETFLAALQISQRQQIRSFPALLTRLATTRAIDKLRERSRGQRHSKPDNWEGILSNNPGPSARVQTEELAQQLRQGLAQLPPLEAKAFCLRHVSDMSYRQIAKELSMTVSSAGVLLYRAKTKLRFYLQSAEGRLDAESRHRQVSLDIEKEINEVTP
jgi:RNA polymerase sigma-70 factor (ECF subfamily)